MPLPEKMEVKNSMQLVRHATHALWLNASSFRGHTYNGIK